MNVPQWTIGERLKKAREDAGLDQEQLAARIGIHPNSVSAYEKNKREHPKRLVVREWARVTAVPEWWIWGSDAPPELLEPSGRTSGWTYGALSLTTWDPAQEFHRIYVSPDQMTLDQAELISTPEPRAVAA